MRNPVYSTMHDDMYKDVHQGIARACDKGPGIGPDEHEAGTHLRHVSPNHSTHCRPKVRPVPAWRLVPACGQPCCAFARPRCACAQLRCAQRGRGSWTRRHPFGEIGAARFPQVTPCRSPKKMSDRRHVVRAQFVAGERISWCISGCALLVEPARLRSPSASWLPENGRRSLCPPGTSVARV